MTNIQKNSVIALFMALGILIIWVAIVYQMVAWFILAGGLLAIVGLVFATAGVSFNVFMLVIVFISELWLGDIDFGPFSLRVYLMVGLLVYLLVTLAIDRDSIFVSDKAQNLAILYLVFILWMILCRMAQGNSFYNIAVGMISTHGVALLVFLLVQKQTGKMQDRRFFVVAISLAIIFSSLIAILQYAGIAWALDLKNLLRPASSSALLFSEEVDRRVVTGLSPSAFAMGYQLAIGLILLVVLFVFPGLAKKYKAVLGGGLLILSLAVLVIQERSTLVAFGFALVLFLFWLWNAPIQKGDDKRAVFNNLAFLAFLGILLFSYQLISGSSMLQGINSRLTNLSDAGRVVLIRQALTFGMTHWLWGGGPALFLLTTASDLNTVYRTAIPHNLFLNAFIYYGIPGLALALLLSFRLFNDCRMFLRSALIRSDAMTIALTFSLLAYLINAQFHNSSFVTGDSLMWWLVGVIYTCPLDPVSGTQKVPATPSRRIAV